MRLFLYGTLNNPDRLAAFAGRPIPVIPAALPGWRRVALLDSRYPTLRRARCSEDGVVATVDRATLARLTAREGPSYRLTPVAVRVAQRSVPSGPGLPPAARGGREWLP